MLANATGSCYDILETPLGWMGLLATAKGLRRTTLPQPTPDDCFSILGAEAAGATQCHERLASVEERLLQYFSGATVSFLDEPVHVDDAPAFSRAAWQACREIPLGETRSYGWLAARAGRPNAPRAAGQAMARNRLPIIIPCHRVIGSDGALRGFGRGKGQLGLKERLLRLEAACG